MASRQTTLLFTMLLTAALTSHPTCAFPFPFLTEGTEAPQDSATAATTTEQQQPTDSATTESQNGNDNGFFPDFVNIHLRGNSSTESPPASACSVKGVHAQLSHSIQLPSESTLTLQSFSSEAKPGVFGLEIGCPFNATSGEFTAPAAGVYFLASQLLFSHSADDETAPVVSAAICVDENCESNASLLSRVLLSSHEGSATIAGLLWLEAAQSVTVRVTNLDLEETVQVLARSSFSAHRLTN